KTVSEVRSGPLDALALDLASQFVDELLPARPIGMHFKQLLESLQCRLFLADLTQDLAQTVERLEVIGIERQGPTQIAQRKFDLAAHEMHVGAPVPGLGKIWRKLHDLVEEFQGKILVFLRYSLH